MEGTFDKGRFMITFAIMEQSWVGISRTNFFKKLDSKRARTNYTGLNELRRMTVIFMQILD